ncbi:MAG: helix-turn-helix domain-containing protein [Candidatus Levybacteria bacterium]|nr:helix-turn-helix domain-containing protein [Candidatus Levybacteria bacterium]
MSSDGWQFKDFVKTLLSVKTEDEMVNFLEGILTPKELLEIPMRLKIVRMLKKGVPQHEIAKELGIGIATVTRGSKEIQRGRFKYI